MSLLRGCDIAILIFLFETFFRIKKRFFSLIFFDVFFKKKFQIRILKSQYRTPQATTFNIYTTTPIAIIIYSNNIGNLVW
jgi:hypothetical protein